MVLGQPLLCRPDGAIDPHVFIDRRGDDATPHLLWKDDSNARGARTTIFLQRLRADGLGLEGAPKPLLSNDPAGWEGPLVEVSSLVLDVFISAASRLHLDCISTASRLHLGCISAASRLHLDYISVASRLQAPWLVLDTSSVPHYYFLFYSANAFNGPKYAVGGPRSGRRILVLQLALERTRIQPYPTVLLFGCTHCISVARSHTAL